MNLSQEEAKRAARLFRKNPINLAAADPAPKSSKVVKRDLSRSQAHIATRRAMGITTMPIKGNATSERTAQPGRSHNKAERTPGILCA